ncbi:MAG: hypothetical protein PHT29_06455, partial [Eubacteriales bacterium]|nr:hypothetical protein [Eubacteriales bacterium]MDD4445722.1 hypothetical protein [Eubacteriales bacterium]
MLYEIVQHFPKDMNFKKEGPLISLYQPTHRSFPENKQDPIVFKNLLRNIENSLKQLPDFHFIDIIMKPFYALKEDKEFWNHTAEGIAVFACLNKCIVYNLNNSVKELAVVANSFHIKPLIKAFQSTENYQLLGLSRENFILYEGNRYGFKEIAIDQDIPRTMKEVLGDQLSDSYLSHASYAGTGTPAMYHGHGDVKQEIDKDTEKYFRYVDSYVFENYSKPSKLPLILISLKEHRSEFKKISNNPYLLEAGIGKSVESLDLAEIHQSAQAIIEAINIEKIKKMAESYAKAEADSLGSSDLDQIAKAAYENRIETMLIEEDTIVPGKIDAGTGKIQRGDLEHPDYDDILDDLAEFVLSSGGNVFVLPKDKMPGDTGVSAIFRYV